MIGWFFRFFFRLRQSTFHWIISDGVVSGLGSKWKRSFFRLRFRRAYDSAYDSDFRFLLLDRERSYDSDSDSDSDSYFVASENTLWEWINRRLYERARGLSYILGYQ